MATATAMWLCGFGVSMAGVYLGIGRVRRAHFRSCGTREAMAGDMRCILAWERGRGGRGAAV